MNRAKLLLAALLAALPASLPAADNPTLVVSIVIDQLRTDYVELLDANFSPGGFRRLKSGGVYMQDVVFDVANLDAASATAMIYTGAYPARTGVPAATVYDSSRRARCSSLADDDAVGNFTTSGYSPRALELSTFADELAVASGGFGSVHSVAATPEQAVVMAGHSGTTAVWLDPHSGKWAGTTFYTPLPQFISNRNYHSPLSQRIDTIVWRPSKAPAAYSATSPLKGPSDFRHTFSRADKEGYSAWSSTPLANREVTDIAIEYLRNLQLGQRSSFTDMLSIGYSLAPFRDGSSPYGRAELEDAYYRLDADLARLFDAIDKTAGLQNTLVFVTSTGYFADASLDDPKFKIPTGTFSVKRALSLLNAFLSAKFGNGDYIASFTDHQVYLDRALIASRGLNLEEVSKEARDFLAKMSGVADAFTMRDIADHSNYRIDPYSRSLSRKSAGDIYVEVSPGWVLEDDTVYPSVKTPVRSESVLTPAFILKPGAAPRKIEYPVEGVRLAPTVTQMLRLKSPNGAMSRPLPVF